MEPDREPRCQICGADADDQNAKDESLWRERGVLPDCLQEHVRRSDGNQELRGFDARHG